jgi:predicted peroxiredoxin
MTHDIGRDEIRELFPRVADFFFAPPALHAMNAEVRIHFFIFGQTLVAHRYDINIVLSGLREPLRELIAHRARPAAQGREFVVEEEEFHRVKSCKRKDERKKGVKSYKMKVER